MFPHPTFFVFRGASMASACDPTISGPGGDIVNMNWISDHPKTVTEMSILLKHPAFRYRDFSFAPHTGMAKNGPSDCETATRPRC
jgi:hypothetical protein